jgi:hypothetical protein
MSRGPRTAPIPDPFRAGLRRPEPPEMGRRKRSSRPDHHPERSQVSHGVTIDPDGGRTYRITSRLQQMTCPHGGGQPQFCSNCYAEAEKSVVESDTVAQLEHRVEALELAIGEFAEWREDADRYLDSVSDRLQRP